MQSRSNILPPTPNITWFPLQKKASQGRVIISFPGLWILFWTLLFLLIFKYSGFIIIRTFILRQQVLQYVSMPPLPSGLLGKNVKSRISHQCWRGWKCDYTSKYFNFLRNHTLSINDVWIFSPIEMNNLQLQTSLVLPSKEAYLLMKIIKFTRFLRYKFTKRCFKSFDLPNLLLEHHLYLFYMFIWCINQFNHLGFCGNYRNTLTLEASFWGGNT